MQLLRGQPDQPSDVLCGWKRIATYLDMSVRSAQRYEQQCGLPVRRATGRSRGAVITTIPELDQWVSTRNGKKDLGSTGPAGAGFDELRAGFNKMQLLVQQMRQLQHEIKERRREMIASLGRLTVTACQQYRRATLEKEKVKDRENSWIDSLLIEANRLNERSLKRSPQDQGIGS